MPNDIRPFGSNEGVAFWWVKNETNMGHGAVGLVAIDEVGEITQTGVSRPHEETVPSRAEAVLEHLADAVAEADANLERYRAKAPREPEEKPPPMDPATQRFLEDGD